MRLRKNMKRTAAAALALSMAVSTAAVPASAGYSIDMSDARITGDVEIKQEADSTGKATITISVGGQNKTTEFSDGKEDDKITITGDNTVTKSAATTTAAADAAKDDTKAPETTVTENKDGTVIDYTGKLDAQPDQEVSRPDSQNDQNDPEADKNDPEADQKNQGDQGDQNDPEADQKNQGDQSDPEADQSGQKNQNDQNKDSEDADAGIMTYEAPAPTTLSNPVAAAIRNVIKIINKVAGAENALNITLDNATIKSDSDDWDDAVMKIAGEGDVNIELNGSNVLTSGLWSAGLGKNDKDSTGRLTIRDDLKNDGTAKTDEEKKAEEDAVAAGKKGSEVENVGSLTATGGKYGAGIGASFTGGNQSTSNIVIEGGTITATGGRDGAGIGGSGYGAGGKVNKDDPDDRSQTITINGGNIVANGIGGGGRGSNGRGGFGAVTINGGHIQSVNDKGAGIGGGWGDQYAGGADVLITGGVIEAEGLGGAGIGGGGSHSDGGVNEGFMGGDAKVKIRGKNTIIQKAVGSVGAGIGGGSASNSRHPSLYNGGSAEIEITDGATVKEAVGGSGGAGIGSGAGDGYQYYGYETHAHVTIKNATVESAKSASPSKSNTYGAGIGGGGTRGKYWNSENVIRIINSVIGRFKLDQNGNCEKDENGNYLLESGTGALGTHGSEGIGRGANESGQLSDERYGKNDVIIDNSWVPDGDTTMKQEFNHDWSDTETLPTCTEDGEKGKVCSRCGMKKETEKIPALGHSWTDNGDGTHICVRGDATEAHAYGEWTTVTAATCTTPGVEKRTCTECGHEETREIPATGHNWVDNGNGTHTCTNCGATEAVGALELRVVDAEGMNKPFTVSQNGTLRTYTGAYDTATLTGNLNTLRYLQDHGAQTIQFVTNGQTSSFDINDLLAQGSGNEVFYLTHRGAEEPTLLLVEADHSELVKD